MRKQINKVILNVAEKPSVAKSISQLLSNNSASTLRSLSKYNPIYSFKYDFQNEDCMMNFTSVAGHIKSIKFKEEYSNWKSIDPAILLDQAEIISYVDENNQVLKQNIQNIAQNANILILWLDCDREGEAIAFEVIEICEEIKKNLKIYRAHFSAVTKQEISNAMRTLTEPNRYLAQAVQARQEVDLRIGAAFTRFQTLTIQPKFRSFYGPCQFPTLGFVVERDKKVNTFIREDF